MTKLFNIGDRITGFCNGYFGRDDYDSKICIMVNDKYAVFQYTEGEWVGYGTILNYEKGLENLVNDWKIE
jgi:hypothetical protein